MMAPFRFPYIAEYCGAGFQPFITAKQTRTS